MNYSDKPAMGEATNRTSDPTGGEIDDAVIELRLPPKPESIPVLRATIGAIAAGMSFNYDEIIELRVAVSEAFDMAIRHLSNGQKRSKPGNITVKFRLAHEQLEFLIPDLSDYSYRLSSQEEQESVALLGSLMDEVEFGAQQDGQRVMRAIKNRASK